jgi:hypothetical protein
MKPRVQRQANLFAYQRFANEENYQHYLKRHREILSPEQKELAAEVAERLRYRREQGDTIEFDADGMTKANEEAQKILLEREENDVDWGYDKASNDQMAGFDEEPYGYDLPAKTGTTNGR